jgi:hypothetical protein
LNALKICLNEFSNLRRVRWYSPRWSINRILVLHPRQIRVPEPNVPQRSLGGERAMRALHVEPSLVELGKAACHLDLQHGPPILMLMTARRNLLYRVAVCSQVWRCTLGSICECRPCCGRATLGDDERAGRQPLALNKENQPTDVGPPLRAEVLARTTFSWVWEAPRQS